MVAGLAVLATLAFQLIGLAGLAFSPPGNFTYVSAYAADPSSCAPSIVAAWAALGLSGRRRTRPSDWVEGLGRALGWLVIALALGLVALRAAFPF